MPSSASYFTSEAYKDYSPYELAAGIKDIDPAYADYSVDEIAAAGTELRKDAPWAGGVGSAFMEGVSSTKDMVRSAWNVWTGDVEDVEKIYQERQTQQMTPARFAFHQALEERKAEGDEGIIDAIMNGVGAAWEQPGGALHEFTANLPNMITVMGSAYAGAKIGGMGGTAAAPGAGTIIGGGIGALAGAVIGIFGANTLLETGSLGQQYAAEGLTEGERHDAIRKGAIKGGVLTIIDGATFSASRLLAGAPGRVVEGAISENLIEKGVDIANKSQLDQALKNPEILREAFDAGSQALSQTMSRGQRMGRGAAGFGLETAGEGVGEFVGTMAIGETPSYTDAFMEAMLASPFSISEMVVARKLEQPRDLTQQLQNIVGAGSVDEALAAADQAVTSAREGVEAKTRQTQAGQQVTLDPNAGLRDPGLSASPEFQAVVNSIFANVQTPELGVADVNQIQMDEMDLARQQNRQPLVKDVVGPAPTPIPDFVGPRQTEGQAQVERGRGAPGQIVPDYTVARGTTETVAGTSVRITSARGDVMQAKEPGGQARMAMDHVGEITGTVGKDGRPIDTVMLDTFRSPELPVHVVDEVGPDGSEFIKNTVVFGAASRPEAMKAYRMSGGNQQIGGIKDMPPEKFQEWVKDPAKIRKKSTLVKFKGGKLAEIGDADKVKRARLQLAPATQRLTKKLGVPSIPVTTGPAAVKPEQMEPAAGAVGRGPAKQTQVPPTQEVEAKVPETPAELPKGAVGPPVDTKLVPTPEPQKVAPSERKSSLGPDQIAKRQPSQTQVSPKAAVGDKPGVSPLGEAEDAALGLTRERVGSGTASSKSLLSKFESEFNVTTGSVREEIIPDTSPLGQIKKQFLEPVLGKRLIVIDDRDMKLPIDGAVLESDPNVIFIAKSSTKPHLKVLGHELLHGMKTDRPELYQDTIVALRPLLLDYDKYRKHLARFGPTDLSTPAVEEELVADLMGEGFADPKFWDSVQKKSPALFERVATAIKTYLDHVVQYFKRHRMTGTKYFTDYEKARDVVADALTKYADVGEKKPLREIQMDREYQVEETGETVKVKEDAAALIREAQTRVKTLNLFGKCIAAR